MSDKKEIYTEEGIKLKMKDAPMDLDSEKPTMGWVFILLGILFLLVVYTYVVIIGSLL